MASSVQPASEIRTRRISTALPSFEKDVSVITMRPLRAMAPIRSSVGPAVQGRFGQGLGVKVSGGDGFDLLQRWEDLGGSGGLLGGGLAELLSCGFLGGAYVAVAAAVVPIFAVSEEAQERQHTVGGDFTVRQHLLEMRQVVLVLRAVGVETLDGAQAEVLGVVDYRSAVNPELVHEFVYGYVELVLGHGDSGADEAPGLKAGTMLYRIGRLAWTGGEPSGSRKRLRLERPASECRPVGLSVAGEVGDRLWLVVLGGSLPSTGCFRLETERVRLALRKVRHMERGNGPQSAQMTPTCGKPTGNSAARGDCRQ